MKYTATTNVASKLKIAIQIPDSKKFNLLPGAECRNCPGGVNEYFSRKEYNNLSSFYKQFESDATVSMIRKVIAEITGTNQVVINENYLVSHAGNGWYRVVQLPNGWDKKSKLPSVSYSRSGYSWGGGDRTNIERNLNTGVLNIPTGGGEIYYTPISETDAEPVVVGEKSFMGGWV